MTLFVEDPLSRIVNIHFEEDEPEPPPPGTTYCGRYGYGARLEDTGRIITAVPFGPHQFPPMAGTFPPSGNVGPAGEQYGSLIGAPMHPTPTMTAAPGVAVTSILLQATYISFTNNQLIFTQDINGHYGTLGWTVPMATGYNDAGRAWVIKSYAIDMAWTASHVNPGDQVGIAVSHPVPHHVGSLPQPPEPAVILGSAAGGAGTFVYDFKYQEWSSGHIHVTPDNQFDPNLGGPAFVWWMGRRMNGDGSMTAWGATTQFMPDVLVALGDHYTWEIVAECQPQPLIIP